MWKVVLGSRKYEFKLLYKTENPIKNIRFSK